MSSNYTSDAVGTNNLETIGGQKLTAPTIPFYNVVGFMINNEIASNGAISIDDDITVTPIYAPK